MEKRFLSCYRQIVEIVQRSPFIEKSKLVEKVSRECVIETRDARRFIDKAHEYDMITKIVVPDDSKRRGRPPERYVVKRKVSETPDETTK